MSNHSTDLASTDRPQLKAVKELGYFLPLYFFLALIELKLKLQTTPAWFNGTLFHNHELLLEFQYTNHEQSRVLQFYIPELLRRLLDISVEHAYILQRWTFTFAVFVIFHLYLRKWFKQGESFAGVLLFAAVMPVAFMNDLQESSPLLLVLYVSALWAIREKRDIPLMILLMLGALTNETIAILSAVYFLYNVRTWRDVPSLVLKTALVTGPMFLILGGIRYLTRHQPVLGSGWHFPDNIQGITRDLHLNILDLHQGSYIFVFLMFNVLWIYAFLRFKEKPLFLRRAALIVPIFVGIHLLTGIISEVRQMLPLSFIIVPMALFLLFPQSEKQQRE